MKHAVRRKVRAAAELTTPGEVCHIDSPAMRVNRVLFWVSVVIYAGAVTLTYAALWWVRMQS